MATTITAGNATNGAAISSDSTGILELKSGTGSGTTAMTVGTGQAVTFAQAANLPNTFGFKNRIINGAMVIDQRNAGASVATTATPAIYSLDRWRNAFSQASKYTIQQNSGSVTPPAGFRNYLGIVSSSAYSVLSNDYFWIQQSIEGFNCADLAWGTANASSVTLSFWVRSSLTGTFGGAFNNASGNRSYPFTYTISAANTWEQKTITVAGDTTGTWATDNSIGINVFFGLGVGSTFSGTAGAWAASNFVSATGATSVVGTNGATFYITGVQLEKGSTATSFDVRPYGTELALCQRYFQRISGQSGDAFAVATAFNATDVYGVYPLKVTMRADPTGTASVSTLFDFYANNAAQACTAISFQQASENQIEISTTQSGRTGGNGGWWRYRIDGWVAFSAEL